MERVHHPSCLFLVLKCLIRKHLGYCLEFFTEQRFLQREENFYFFLNAGGEMKVSSRYTAPCQVLSCCTEKLCSKWEIVLFATSQLSKSHLPKYSKPAVYWERGTVLVTCVIIQKIIHEKRKLGSHMKYFCYLGVQSSAPCLREHVVVLPVNSDPWSNAQNWVLPSLSCIFLSPEVLWKGRPLSSISNSWVKAVN